MKRPVKRLSLLLVSLALGATLEARQSRPKFYDDDPISNEPITRNVTKAAHYEPDYFYEFVSNIFWHPGSPVLGQRAGNINTVDEVPDGPFFMNRAGSIALTPALVARAANAGNGPAPGPWRIISAKSDGVSPGFTIRDGAGKVWYLKFDPPGFRGMATGSEIVGAKLFWALGFHTSEYYIARLVPSNLVITPEAMVTPPGEAKRAMRQADVDWLLRNSDREPDGSYRVVASLAMPGHYVGRILFEGTRTDDPNDIVPHEHRRELRGYFVFAAWLDHVDVKGTNSIVTDVTEGGRSFIRRYLLDFGSILGSAGNKPRERWEGFETFVEPLGEIAKRAVTFGLLIPEWRRMAFYESPAIGRIPRDNSSWNPDAWKPHITNAAFRHIRADDKFWAARKVAFITEEMVRAAVAEGQFGDAAAEEALVKMIMERRARILATYLPAVNPIVEPALDGQGQLTFRNIAVDTGVAPPSAGYRAAWSTFDNTTGSATPVGVTSSAGTALSAPKIPVTEFLKVEVTAVRPPVSSWEVPVTLYFRNRGGTWKLVGLERLPDRR
jgi:hypothetical protein